MQQKQLAMHSGRNLKSHQINNFSFLHKRPFTVIGLKEFLNIKIGSFVLYISDILYGTQTPKSRFKVMRSHIFVEEIPKFHISLIGSLVNNVM